MRVSGRRAIPLTEEQKDAVLDYLNSDKTYLEVAEQHKVNVNSLKYWVAKYRKEQSSNGRQETDN